VFALIFGFWAHPRRAGSGFPLQFLVVTIGNTRNLRFNPLRGITSGKRGSALGLPDVSKAQSLPACAA
jgi:hypothetical protein